MPEENIRRTFLLILFFMRYALENVSIQYTIMSSVQLVLVGNMQGEGWGWQGRIENDNLLYCFRFLLFASHCFLVVTSSSICSGCGCAFWQGVSDEVRCVQTEIGVIGVCVCVCDGIGTS